jgi:hypothetical protein
MKKVLFGLIATVMLGFVGNAQSLRADFLKGKTHRQAVEAFNQLTESDQKKLWIEKIDQILSQNLPIEHKKLVTEIRTGVDKGVDKNSAQAFLGSAANLARITPAKDFGNMFETLADFKYDGKFVNTKKMPESIILDIQNLDLFARGNCSCRWCLGQGSTGSNCKATLDGCGFLWLQACNQCVLCL